MSQRRKQIVFLIPRNTVTQTLKFQIFMISLTVRLILSEMTDHYTINQSTVPTLFIMYKCILYHLPTLQTNYISCSFCLFFFLLFCACYIFPSPNGDILFYFEFASFNTILSRVELLCLKAQCLHTVYVYQDMAECRVRMHLTCQVQMSYAYQ